MRGILVILLFVWLLAFLYLTLWPFDFSQTNLATFIPGKGLLFSSPSIAVSESAPSKIAGLDSIAILLKFLPDTTTNEPGCILDYSPIAARANLRIVQQGHSLYFMCRGPDARMQQLRVSLGNLDSTCTLLFAARGRSLSITDSRKVVASAETPTPTGYRWDRNALLIFGCTASGSWRWGGTLLTFEVYRIDGANPVPRRNNELLSYQFARHNNRLIPDMGSEPHVALLVPAQVKPPARHVLSSPLAHWDGYWNTFDIVSNIIAFLPLGLLLGLLFNGRLGAWPLILALTGIGCTISLSIEVAQFYLPWRDSSIIDVLTNTFGAFSGGWTATRLFPRFSFFRGHE